MTTNRSLKLCRYTSLSGNHRNQISNQVGRDHWNFSPTLKTGVFIKLDQVAFISTQILKTLQKMEISCPCTSLNTSGRALPSHPAGITLAAACDHRLSFFCCAPLNKVWLHPHYNSSWESRGLQFNHLSPFFLKYTNAATAASPYLFQYPSHGSPHWPSSSLPVSHSYWVPNFTVYTR